MRRLGQRLPEWGVPLVYLLFALAAFGILIPWLGFYWDDWAQLFAHHAFGANGFWAYFSSDRPTSAWTHVLLSPLLGASSPAWHLFTLLLRWLAGVLAWRLFLLLWPARRWQAAAAGLIFILYPEFSQQAISVAYHQHWLQYVLFLGSLLAMLRAQRAGRRAAWLWTLLGLGAQLLQFSITEYFAASELLRPLMLFFLYSRLDPQASWRRSTTRALRAWLPYALLLAGFIAWRLFIFGGTGADWNSPALLLAFRTQPLSALLQLARIVFWDLMYILISSWARVFSVTPAETSQPFVLAAWALGLLAGAAGAAFVLLLKEDPSGVPTPAPKRSALEVLCFSLAAILLGPAPKWALGGTILNDGDPYHADRFALAALFGIGLLASLLVDWLGRERLQKAALAGTLIGLALCYQLRAENEYRRLWQEQTRFLWQLSWRVPGLQANTAFITEEVIFPFQGNFSTASAINLLYAQTGLPQRVETWIYALLPRFADRDQSPGTVSLHTSMRTSTFNGSSAAAIFLEKDNPRQNCLWVLTSADRDNPTLSAFYQSWLNDAYRRQITTANALPEAAIERYLGRRPGQDWCELFEKAELAAQLGDWAEGARLGDAARQQGFRPQKSPSDSPREWLAFIAAYAHSGRWSTAAELTLDAERVDPAYRKMLCGVWGEALATTRPANPDDQNALQQVQTQLQCSFP